MRFSIAILTLAAAAQAYHVSFFIGPNCEGEELGAFSVTTGSGCRSDYAGQAESVLVRTDNMNDANTYLNIFSHPQCGGPGDGRYVHNENTCLELSGLGQPEYMSYDVAQYPDTGVDAVRTMSNTSAQEHEELWSSPHFNGDVFPLLVSPGVWRVVPHSDLNADGSLPSDIDYLDDWSWTGWPMPNSTAENPTAELQEHAIVDGFCQVFSYCKDKAIGALYLTAPYIDRVTNAIPARATWDQLSRHPIAASVASGVIVYYATAGAKPSDNNKCDTTTDLKTFSKDILSRAIANGETSSQGVEKACNETNNLCSVARYAVFRQGMEPHDGCYYRSFGG